MSVKNVLRVANSNRSKPTFSLDDKDLPDIKEWKVGGKYKIMLEVEQVGADKGDPWDDGESKRLNGRFKILKAKSCDEDM